MPMLDELMRGGSGQGAPGENPGIDQLLGRISSMQQTVQGPGGGVMPSGSPMPGSAPGGMTGPATSLGAPEIDKAGSGAPMDPSQANLTYQMLIKAGVPPQIAKQAIAEPKFLQEILLQIQKTQLGAPQMAPQQPQPRPAG